MHRNPKFQNDDYQFTFNDLSSDKNFVLNDMLNSFVVNFDNFCKKTHLRFDGHHKAEVTAGESVKFAVKQYITLPT